MRARRQYDIEFYMEAPVSKWRSLPSFRYMQKSYAMGAWNMLKSQYCQQYTYRLIKDGEVIETCGKKQYIVGSKA